MNKSKSDFDIFLDNLFLTCMAILCGIGILGLIAFIKAIVFILG